MAAKNKVKRVRLPRLSTRQVDWRNLLASRDHAVPFTRGEDGMRLVLAVADDAPPTGTLVQCLAGDAPFALAVDETRLNEFYPDGVADVAISTLPQPLAHALAAVAFHPLMEGLETCLGGPVTFQGLTGEVPADWHPVALAATANGSAAPAVVMHLSADAEAGLAAFLRTRPSRATWPAAPAARVVITICLRGYELTAGERAALKPGGAILLPTDTDATRPMVLLGRPARPVGIGRIESDRVIVEKLMDEAMSEDIQEIEETYELVDEKPPHETGDETGADSGEETVEAAGPAEVSLQDVAVGVDFMLARTSMTFADLQAFTPGFAIKLDRPVSSAVTIVVSGRAVGEGELVQIDDRLGVRITRLVERNDDQPA